MRPAYLSVSQLSCFLGCPAKYKFRYLDQVEPAFRSPALVLGSAVHSTLDWLHRAWKEERTVSEEEVLRIFEADLAAQLSDGPNDPSPGSRVSLQETGRGLLTVYLAETPPKVVRATEIPFEVPVIHPGTGEAIPVPLRGYFDLIEGDGTLVELKTAARKPDRASLELNFQLSGYSYAAMKIYHERPGMRLDCLVKTKVPRLERIPVERGEADDARFFLMAREVLAAIEAGAFFPNPGWACRGCEYRHVCPVWSS